MYSRPVAECNDRVEFLYLNWHDKVARLQCEPELNGLDDAFGDSAPRSRFVRGSEGAEQFQERQHGESVTPACGVGSNCENVRSVTGGWPIKQRLVRGFAFCILPLLCELISAIRA